MQFENTNEFDTFLFHTIVMTNDLNPCKIMNKIISELVYPRSSYQIILR